MLIGHGFVGIDRTERRVAQCSDGGKSENVRGGGRTAGEGEGAGGEATPHCEVEAEDTEEGGIELERQGLVAG